ncbi:MAG: hypothetical protein JST58_17390, partial [Bacteroidetes bacterium]|nr:hypothetical protein [Bacteroidota bacterium]
PGRDVFQMPPQHAKPWPLYAILVLKMKEQTLFDYFQSKATVEELAVELKLAQQRTSYDTTTVYVSPMDIDTQFEITKHHLIKLCDDTLNGNLTTADINTIAFAIITSEFFTLDNDAENASIIENVLEDWDNPETGYPLTLDNMRNWKDYLQTGNYNLNLDQPKKKL